MNPKKLSIIFLETLNIEWGQIDPKGNRRVKTVNKKNITTYTNSGFIAGLLYETGLALAWCT